MKHTGDPLGENQDVTTTEHALRVEYSHAPAGHCIAIAIRAFYLDRQESVLRTAKIVS